MKRRRKDSPSRSFPCSICGQSVSAMFYTEAYREGSWCNICLVTAIGCAGDVPEPVWMAERMLEGK